MTTTPRIYVACLAAYNAGTLHGAWIDADQSAEAIWAEIRAMLATSPENSTCQWCGATLTSADGIVRWNKACTYGGHLPGNAEEWAIAYFGESATLFRSFRHPSSDGIDGALAA